MVLNKAFALRVNRMLEEKKMSKYKLEKITGISHGTFRNIFSEVNKDLKFSTMAKIIHALDMTIPEFFNDKLFDFANLEYEY
ncbi:MAG: helix-turn-helix transcriptional regulator [Clostridia bacterium]|nr:helix-turn-helix transcriptional regulator [Clostridia bacterium]